MKKKLKAFNNCIEFFEIKLKNNERIVDNIFEIKKFLKSKDWQTRSFIAQSLVNFDEPSSEDFLCDLLTDKNWQVRSNAIQGLEILGKDHALIYLYKAAEKEKLNLNIISIVYAVTIIHLRNNFHIEKLRLWLYELKFEFGINIYILPKILAAFILIGEEYYYDELINLFSINNSKELKLSVVQSLYSIVKFESDNKINKIKTRIYNYFCLLNIGENDDFPYINYVINDIKKCIESE